MFIFINECLEKNFLVKNFASTGQIRIRDFKTFWV